MDKLRALQYFVAAADESSFAGAARRLDVSVPAIHKLVAALERSLGVRLFERSVRGLTLTASGVDYLESCRPLLDELMAVDARLSRSALRPSGTLVVGAHAQLAQHILLPAMPRFHSIYPDIEIDLRVVNRMSDADADAVDVFLLQGWPEAPDFVHRQLGLSTSSIFAAPEYWAAHGVPQHPNELAQHTCLMMRNPAGILIDLWEFARGHETAAVKVSGWLSSNGREVVLGAVLAGEGVGRFNQVTTIAHSRSGRLIPVLVDWVVKGGPPVNLLYRPAQRRTPRVRLFIDFVTDLLRATEDDLVGSSAKSRNERPHWHRRGHGRASSVLRSRSGKRA